MTGKPGHTGAPAPGLDAQCPYHGLKAMHDPVGCGHLEAARALVKAGAGMALRTYAGLTPEELAVFYEYNELSRFLADAERA